MKIGTKTKIWRMAKLWQTLVDKVRRAWVSGGQPLLRRKVKEMER